jgi:photosystem II stability/assembly factor-like uncharacterized protein
MFHPSRGRADRRVLALLTLALVGVIRAGEESHADASLRSITFLDAQEGWAAGDEGVIWHTLNGGKTWSREKSGTPLTITSIQVMADGRGWFGTRESLVSNPGSRGQLFATEAGLTWKPLPSAFLPGVRRIVMTDPDNGWLVGETSDQHPSGLFFTADGGRSWLPYQGVRFPGWCDAWFPGQRLGFVVGQDNTAGRMEDGVLRQAGLQMKGRGPINAITGQGTLVVAAGDSGNVRISRDVGKTWSEVTIPGPAEAVKLWDLRAASVVGNHIWIIGRPGSIVLHSPDRGATWQIQKTGQPVPMEALAFVDEKRGWAAGAFGTILATSDGGETWTVQRQGGRRAGILWLNADARKIPLSVVARYGLEGGMLNVSTSLAGLDLTEDHANVCQRAVRFASAFRAAGGSATESISRFPLSDERRGEPREALLSLLARGISGKPEEVEAELQRELTLATRTWQPAVIVTDHYEGSSGGSPLTGLISKNVGASAQVCGQNTTFPEQLSFFGLAAHTPDRVFALSGRRQAAVRLDPNEGSTKLGGTYEDEAAKARMLVMDTLRGFDTVTGFDLLALAGPAPGEGSLVEGLTFAPGVAARAIAFEGLLEEAGRKDMEIKRKLLALADEVGRAGPQVFSKLPALAGELERADAGAVLAHLVRRLIETGQWDPAYAVCEYMVQFFPEHPCSAEACRWMISFRTSNEVRRQLPELRDRAKKSGDAVMKIDSVASRVVGRDVRKGDLEPNSLTFWHRSALGFGNRLRRMSPHLWADPRVQLALASAQRRLDNPEDAEDHFKMIFEMDAESPWSLIVRNERAYREGSGLDLARDTRLDPARKSTNDRVFIVSPLAKNTINEPRRIAWSSETDAGVKPRLDGLLDENLWRLGKQLDMRGMRPGSEIRHATFVTLRHDADNLYIGLDCHWPAGTKPGAAVKHQGPDADISRSDRVEIILDLDRDYSTWYRFAIDHRGLTAEDCWGDVSWNPKWFHAVQISETGWQAEIAIPVRELVNPEDLGTEPWACNIQRVVPGLGTLALTIPAGTEIRPEGFTHLRFLYRKQALPEDVRKKIGIKAN